MSHGACGAPSPPLGAGLRGGGCSEWHPSPLHAEGGWGVAACVCVHVCAHVCSKLHSLSRAGTWDTTGRPCLHRLSPSPHRTTCSRRKPRCLCATRFFLGQAMAEAGYANTVGGTLRKISAARMCQSERNWSVDGALCASGPHACRQGRQVLSYPPLFPAAHTRTYTVTS